MFGFHMALCLAVAGAGLNSYVRGLDINDGPNAAEDALCSLQKPCDKGQGDCQTDQDCGSGLFCGKNNCWGEFGFTPQGSRKDDCCTDHLNYCSPADLLPRSRKTCCSPDEPCPAGHGDCDTDNDCESGLKCGNNNCKKFHPFADDNDDCCVDPNISSPPSGPSVGEQQTEPTWRFCSFQNLCDVGEGDCAGHDTCAGDLICGSNNCRLFHPTAHPKMDCCVPNNRKYLPVTYKLLSSGITSRNIYIYRG